MIYGLIASLLIIMIVYRYGFEGLDKAFEYQDLPWKEMLVLLFYPVIYIIIGLPRDIICKCKRRKKHNSPESASQ